MRKKFIYVFWVFVVGVLLVIVFIFIVIVKGWIGYVLFIEELENLNLKFVIEIIFDDGKMLGIWLFSKENCVFVGYDQFLLNLICVLIVIEDECFVEYFGIDVCVFVCVLVKWGVMMQKNVGGGSIIIQQLVK